MMVTAWPWRSPRLRESAAHGRQSAHIQQQSQSCVAPDEASPSGHQDVLLPCRYAHWLHAAHAQEGLRAGKVSTGIRSPHSRLATRQEGQDGQARHRGGAGVEKRAALARAALHGRVDWRGSVRAARWFPEQARTGAQHLGALKTLRPQAVQRGHRREKRLSLPRGSFSPRVRRSLPILGGYPRPGSARYAGRLSSKLSRLLRVDGGSPLRRRKARPFRRGCGGDAGQAPALRRCRSRARGGSHAGERGAGECGVVRAAGGAGGPSDQGACSRSCLPNARVFRRAELTRRRARARRSCTRW